MNGRGSRPPPRPLLPSSLFLFFSLFLRFFCHLLPYSRFSHFLSVLIRYSLSYFLIPLYVAFPAFLFFLSLPLLLLLPFPYSPYSSSHPPSIATISPFIFPPPTDIYRPLLLLSNFSSLYTSNYLIIIFLFLFIFHSFYINFPSLLIPSSSILVSLPLLLLPYFSSNLHPYFYAFASLIPFSSSLYPAFSTMSFTLSLSPFYRYFCVLTSHTQFLYPFHP